MLWWEWETHHEYLCTSGCALERLFLRSRRTLLQQRCPEERRRQASICKFKGVVFLVWFWFCVVFFFQPGPALHDVGSDAAQLLSFDLSMLYLLLVLCRFPVSAVSPEARREMLCFKQDGLWIVCLKENSSSSKRCDFFGDWSVCFPQNNEKEWLSAGNPSSWLPYVISLLICICKFSPTV